MTHRLLSLLACCLVLAACSSGNSSATGGDAGDGGTGVSAEQACGDLAHARCTALEACSALRVQVQYGDEATCEARNKTNCVDALAAPSTAASPQTSEACATAYAGWSCANLLDDENVPTACAQVRGSLAGGASCAFPGQCPTGFCAIAPDSACGTCAPQPKAGDSCANLTGCGQGLICTADTQTCQPYVAQGGKCGKGLPCGTGLSCVGSDAATGTTGTCQAAVSMQGASCDPTGKTGPGCSRDKGLTCNGASKQCAPLAVVGGGQPCGIVNGQAVVCGSAGVCSGASGTTPGTCTAAASDGASCSTPGLKGCETLARCITAGEGGATGTCTLQNASVCP